MVHQETYFQSREFHQKLKSIQLKSLHNYYATLLGYQHPQENLYLIPLLALDQLLLQHVRPKERLLVLNLIQSIIAKSSRDSQEKKQLNKVMKLNRKMKISILKYKMGITNGESCNRGRES